MIVVRLGSVINVDVSGDLCIFHKTYVQSITSDVLMIIYSYLIQMRRIYHESKMSKENQEIKEKLISNFKSTKLTTNLSKDIVNLIAEMTTQALQMSQEDKKDEYN